MSHQEPTPILLQQTDPESSPETQEHDRLVFISAFSSSILIQAEPASPKMRGAPLVCRGQAGGQAAL